MQPRGSHFATRRRALIAIMLCLLVGLAFAANYRPLTHYVDARSRLDKRTAEVAILKTQNAELQTRLSKLLQPGYLEELARQELTYSLPGEDLFIVTGDSTAPTKSTGTGGAGVGGISSPTTIAGATDPATPTGSQDARPGFLERLLSSIASLF